MFFKRRKSIVWLLASCLLLTQIVLSPIFAQSTGTDRLSGADRYKTAVAVSQKGWKTSEYAVLARGDNFSDALCAGPLAHKYSGPILLTQPNKLNLDTLAELKRLGVKHLFIAGGVGAVSQGIENALKANGITTIERIYGSNRYDTSVKIAEKVGNTGKAVLATGADFPDALSISSIAAKLGMPILLTDKNTLPGTVATYLQTGTITQTYVVGGTGVISNEVANNVPGASRLAGGDRYATNVAIMQNFAGELNFDNIYVAIGTNFADALTGAVLAAKLSAPLVLTRSTIPSGTASYLQTQLTLSTKVMGLGGKSVVPSAILTGLISAKEQIPVQEKYSTAGTYGPATGTKTIEGSVIISAANVTLRNTTIEGDLLLGQSIGDGNVHLTDVTVKGKTIVNGGGPNSIIMYNFNGVTIIVDVPDGASVRLVAQGNTTVANVFMEGNGMLQEAALSGSGFINVAIPIGAEVILNGDFSQVNVEGNGANVSIVSGNISMLSIPENAVGAQINIAAGAHVTTLNANAAASITGEGQISNANITVNGVTIEQTPATTTMPPGVTAVISDQQLSGTNTSTAGGGGGGDSSVTVSPVTSAGVDLRSGSIIMGYSFNGGAITYTQAISNTYGLDLANSTVTLAVLNGGNYIQVGNTVPLSSLTISDSNFPGESANVTFADFGVLLDTFGLDFTDPTNIPTHVKVIVKAKTSLGGQPVANPWGPIDSGWVAIDNNLIPAIDANNSTATITPNNKTTGFPFPVTITIKDAANNNLPDGLYTVVILNAATPIGGGQVSFINGQASVNALITDPGTNTLTVKVNNTTIHTIADVITVTSPIFESSEATFAGDKILLTFSKNMADPSGKHAQFAVTVNGVNNPITAAALNADNKIIELTLTNPLGGGELLTIAYTQGDVTSADGGILCTFLPGLSNTAVSSKNNGGGNPHYGITVHPSSLIPSDNPIITSGTPITTDTTVETFVGNINIPMGAQYKIANVLTVPGPFETWDFATIIGKGAAQTLEANDLLLILAADGTTLRGYYITLPV